eukprot:6977593-Prymnesium_polylepis.1
MFCFTPISSTGATRVVDHFAVKSGALDGQGRVRSPARGDSRQAKGHGGVAYPGPGGVCAQSAGGEGAGDTARSAGHQGRLQVR